MQMLNTELVLVLELLKLLLRRLLVVLLILRGGCNSLVQALANE
jgi:hypothetical protein